MTPICFALLKGISLGLILAVTSTGQAIICIQETLKRGLIYGVISGFGVAVADSSFSLAAGLGVQFVREVIQSYSSIMHISGSCLILAFGMVMFFGKSEIDLTTVSEGRSRWKLVNAFLPNFLFTALHPVTLLFFTAAFASLPLAVGPGPLDPSQLQSGQLDRLRMVSFISLGVFSGAMIWWAGLAWSVDRFVRNRMTTAVLLKFKKVFAAILVLLGAGMLINYTLFA